MLAISGLSKTYGSLVALDDVSMHVAPGEILGLLGPNGAGKTTLVSIVAGLRQADAGSVEVANVDVQSDPALAQRQIGLAPQETGVYMTLTVRENLQFFGELAGLRRQALSDAIEGISEILSLDALADRRAHVLSGGERRRLHTAMALLHRPPLVLLDEPTTGADVESRARLLDLVRSLAAEGAAVVYSTHYLTEVEQLRTSVAILDSGKLIARGGVDDLIAAHGVPVVELRFEGAAPEVRGAELDGPTLRLSSKQPSSDLAKLMATLGENASKMQSVEILRPGLDAVFLKLTGSRYDGTGELGFTERAEHVDTP